MFIDYADLGRVGVVVFFLISGYVIPFGFQHLPSFLLSRLFRLYPAYWMSVIAAVLLTVALKSTALSLHTVPANEVGRTVRHSLLGKASPRSSP